MRFGIVKFAMLIKRGKRQIMERSELLHQEKSKRLKKRKITSTCEYWERVPSNKWREKKNKKKVPVINEKISQNLSPRQKSHQKDKYHVGLSCKILGTILKMDQRTTKSMHKLLHPRDDIGRL